MADLQFDVDEDGVSDGHEDGDREARADAEGDVLSVVVAETVELIVDETVRLTHIVPVNDAEADALVESVVEGDSDVKTLPDASVEKVADGHEDDDRVA